MVFKRMGLTVGYEFQSHFLALSGCITLGRELNYVASSIK